MNANKSYEAVLYLFRKKYRLSNCFERYFVYLKAEFMLAKSTIDKYLEISRRLLSDDLLGDINVMRIRVGKIQKLKVALNEKSLSPSRKNHFLIVLSGLLKFLEEIEQIKVYPYSNIRKYKVLDKKIVTFSEKQLKKIISQIPVHVISGLRLKALVYCLISSACRLGEALSLNKGDIDYKKGVAEVKVKGGRRNQIVLNKEALKAIKAYLKARKDKHSALFVSLNQYKPRRWQVGDAGRTIRHFGLKHGIKNLHAHKIRKSSATILYQKGAPLSVVQRYLSHTNPSTSIKYYLGDIEFSEVKKWQVKAMESVFKSK